MAMILFVAVQAISQSAPTLPIDKNQKDKQKMQTNVSGKFVDSNKDGVCDNYQARMKNGQGASFVDKNGDGICDNQENAGQEKPKGCGMGHQHRHGQADGNCSKKGNGYQQRNRCRNQTIPASDPQKSDDIKK